MALWYYGHCPSALDIFFPLLGISFREEKTLSSYRWASARLLILVRKCAAAQNSWRSQWSHLLILLFSPLLFWHYQQYLRLDDELAEDSRRNKSCRYCGCVTRQCICNSNLRYYWEAAQLLSLVTAERVFSLLNNHFNQNQTRTLADQIFLSLYLSYNKRKLWM